MKQRTTFFRIPLFLITLPAVCFLSTFASALDELVVKKEFKLKNYQTVGGKSLPEVRIGYETYGTLNAEKTNVILITHYFSGSSHAAGKYKASDVAPGYWDSVIGPGKPFDTSKYFVISSDTLVNINPKDPNIITTGPLSVNPKTGKPYGPDFPVVTFRDFVRVQKALLDSLGVTRLTAVAGPSGGSLQALQWSVEFPDFVERVIAVISPGLSMPPHTILVLNGWASPILRDPKWKNGRYKKGQEPNEGLAEALKAVTTWASDFAWAEQTFGNQPTDSKKSPTESLKNTYLIESKLQESSLSKTKTVDANSFLYLIRANQAFNVENDISKIKAPILFVSVKTDLLFPPELADKAAEKIRKAGGTASVKVIEGAGGHLYGLTGLADASEEISRFLRQPATKK
ncbi:MAG: homoserine O-acetyltransferase [Bdellovibrionales bacterium]